jgi:hypothetical protein
MSKRLYLNGSSGTGKIIANHYGECAAITEKEVKGYFPNSHSAIEAMSKRYEQERFIVQDCLPLEEDTMHYYTGIFSFI